MVICGHRLEGQSKMEGIAAGAHHFEEELCGGQCAVLRLTSLIIRADCAEPNFVLPCHFGSEAAHHQRQGEYYHIFVLVIL